MKYYFVLFKLQDGETGNAYSVVNEVLIKIIPPKIIKAKKEVPNELYNKQELKSLMEELGGVWYVS